MSWKISIVVLTAVLLIGCGRATVPIINYNHVAFSATSLTLTLSQTREAIITAAETKGWMVQDEGSGRLGASLTVRDKHTVKVLITFTTTDFSINYVDSTNMKYEVDAGKPTIHPFYNKWVKTLEEAIKLETRRLR